MNTDLMLELLHQLQKDVALVREDVRETKLKLAALEPYLVALAEQQADSASVQQPVPQQPRGLEIGDEGC